MGKILRWSVFFVGEPSSVLKKTNLVSISKAITENDRNVSKKIVAETFKSKIGSGEVSAERFEESMGSSIHESAISGWKK